MLVLCGQCWTVITGTAHTQSRGWTLEESVVFTKSVLKQMHFIEADVEDACPRTSGRRWRRRPLHPSPRSAYGSRFFSFLYLKSSENECQVGHWRHITASWWIIHNGQNTWVVTYLLIQPYWKHFYVHINTVAFFNRRAWAVNTCTFYMRVFILEWMRASTVWLKKVDAAATGPACQIKSTRFPCF